MPTSLPRRKILPHESPLWIGSGSIHFSTTCCTPRGANQLCHTETRDAIFESVRFRQQRGDWPMRLLVLMPDHLHALTSVPGDARLKKAISEWKSLLARTVHIRWQRDFFEHRLRAEESLDLKAAYIRENPVRAGFVARVEEWAFMWEPHDGGPGRSALPL